MTPRSFYLPRQAGGITTATTPATCQPTAATPIHSPLKNPCNRGKKFFTNRADTVSFSCKFDWRSTFDLQLFHFPFQTSKMEEFWEIWSKTVQIRSAFVAICLVGAS